MRKKKKSLHKAMGKNRKEVKKIVSRNIQTNKSRSVRAAVTVVF